MLSVVLMQTSALERVLCSLCTAQSRDIGAAVRVALSRVMVATVLVAWSRLGTVTITEAARQEDTRSAETEACGMNAGEATFSVD